MKKKLHWRENARWNSDVSDSCWINLHSRCLSL